MQYVGQRLAADEGYVVELTVVAARTHGADQRRAGLVGADLDDGRRLGWQERRNGLRDVSAIALYGTEGDDREIALLERTLDAIEARFSVSVVLVENCDARDAEVDQLVDQVLGLVEVAGANIEHITIDGISQRLSAGE